MRPPPHRAQWLLPALLPACALGLVSSPQLSSKAPGLPGQVLIPAPDERSLCSPSPQTIRAARDALQQNGFVVLGGASGEGLIDSQLVRSARDQARVDLDAMLGRLRKQGFDPDSSSFSFAEVVHRSARRYDLRLDRRRLPPASPWNFLSEAAAAWAIPILETCDVQEALEAAVEGVLTSLPGAPHQRFHQDGPHKGSYNCFVPLVDVGAQGTGTEFWEASHTNPIVPELVLSGALGVEEASQLAAVAGNGEDSVSIVQPNLSAGDMLLYDYRVIHRGPANPTESSRPIYYCGFADTAGAGDGYNFKEHRRLEDFERRRDLFGI